MTIRVVSQWPELHWGPGPSWQRKMRDRQGEENLGEHWEIWVVRECAMNLDQSTEHEVGKLDRPWLSQGCFLRPSGQPHSVKACVFFFSNIYLLLKSHLDRVRVGWMRGHDGNGAGILCWLSPGTDGAPTGEAHCPLPPWKRAAPCIPAFEPVFFCQQKWQSLAGPLSTPNSALPVGHTSPASPAWGPSWVFPNGNWCSLQQPGFLVTSPDMALTEKIAKWIPWAMEHRFLV